MSHGAPLSSVWSRHLSVSVSSSDDTNWGFEDGGEGSSSMTLGVRKQSLRNITPRSYSNLLKSESEDEGEDVKPVKSPVKPNVAAAASNDGKLCFCASNHSWCLLVTVLILQIETCFTNYHNFYIYIYLCSQ